MIVLYIYIDGFVIKTQELEQTTGLTSPTKKSDEPLMPFNPEEKLRPAQ